MCELEITQDKINPYSDYALMGFDYSRDFGSDYTVYILEHVKVVMGESLFEWLNIMEREYPLLTWRYKAIDL